MYPLVRILREHTDGDLKTILPATTGPGLELSPRRKNGHLRAEVRARFGENARSQRAALLRTLRTVGVDTLELNTSQPYLTPLLKFFQTRERRRG